jgi:hypothetical protein
MTVLRLRLLAVALVIGSTIATGRGPILTVEGAEGGDEVIAVAAEGLIPFEIRVPRLPVGPLTKLAGLPAGDPVQTTAAIQTAIDACHRAGGGIVELPPGVHITGSIRLLDGVFLHIPADTVLQAWRPDKSPPKAGANDGDDRGMFKRLFPPVVSRWEGETTTMPSPLIWADKARRIGLFGQGEVFGSDRAVVFKECEGVRVQDLVIRNTWRWSVVALYCSDVLFDGVTLLTRGKNTDGINPDSSRRVAIRRCYFETGDDCIAIKSGKGEDGRKVNRPTEDLLIEDCQLVKGHGFAIGSEMSGGVGNVLIRRVSAGVPLRIKTGSERGGYIRQIRYQDVHVGMPQDLKSIPMKGPELTYAGNNLASPFLPVVEDIVFDLIACRRDAQGVIKEAGRLFARFQVPKGTLTGEFKDQSFTPMDPATVPPPPQGGLMIRLSALSSRSTGEDLALLKRCAERYADFKLGVVAKERLAAP